MKIILSKYVVLKGFIYYNWKEDFIYYPVKKMAALKKVKRVSMKKLNEMNRLRQMAINFIFQCYLQTIRKDIN